MTRRSTVGGALGAVALTLAGAVLAAAPALADDGPVSATSPDGRAYGSASLDFRSALRVNINDLYVNDRCPGDGVAAKINLYVGHGGTILDMVWIKVGERVDSGGCGSVVDGIRGAVARRQALSRDRGTRTWLQTRPAR